MKRYLSSTIIALVVLLTACPAFGQREGRERGRPPGEGRARFQNLSEEERAKMRERFQNMSEEERKEFRARMRERFGSTTPPTRPGPSPRMAEEQIEKLKQKHQESIGELKAIRELAVKEKAKKTAARLEKLIARRQQEFEETLQALEQRRQRSERVRRERPGRRPPVERPEAGKPAPQFTLKSFDGKTVRLSDYRGKIVVLEWLNFECPFVKYHYGKPQTMLKLANKYKRKNVVWLAVNSTSHTTPEANKGFAEKQKLPYPILDDRPGRVGRAYGAKTTPHMYIISPRGRIVYDGGIDNSPNGRTPAGQELTNYVDKALTELTARKAVSTAKTKPYGCSVKYPR